MVTAKILLRSYNISYNSPYDIAMIIHTHICI